MYKPLSNQMKPTYQASISMHLFLFVTICENLFESLLIYDHLWESIFLSLYENKQVDEYHCLKQIFYHQNMIMIFCWFRMFSFYVFTLNSSHFMSDYFLLNKVSLNSLNSVAISTPFAVLDISQSIFFMECIFDFNPTNS